MDEFYTLVSAMRNAQKMYFKTRSSDWLIKSKGFEKQVDDYLAAAYRGEVPNAG